MQNMTQMRVSEAGLDKSKPVLRRKNRLARNTLLLYFMAGLIIAFVIPENILEHSWARRFADFMSFIPYIEKAGQVSPIPQIAQFFAAVMFILSWVMIPPMWRSAYPFPSEITSGRIRVWQVLKYGAAILFMVALIVNLIFYPSFGSKFGLMQISSRIGMGIYGTVVFGGVPFISMVVVLFIKNWRHIVYGDMVKLVRRNSKFH